MLIHAMNSRGIHKLNALCAVTAATVTALVHAQPLYAPDEQIEAFKLGADRGCRQFGLKFGLAPTEVASTCDCRKRATEEALSEDEWKQFGQAMSRLDEKEIDRFAQRILAETLKVCGKRTQQSS